ncbi:TonB-dependent receptor [bacterium SCSIO 12696]|nr:TonB-dependent receptor [bacterium SCSIO 12696]
MKNKLAYQVLPITLFALDGMSTFAYGQEDSAKEGANKREIQEEVVVTGTRSSIANSILSKKDAASISDSLSADDAGRFPDNNIAEALARIPGVSFQRDNDTSDGEFISIRGLDTSFNTVLNDGLRLGTADEFRRTPLNVVSGDGVSNIVVTKAPLPEHASEGIGGIVDIRTRGALERREGGSISLENINNSFAEDNGYRYSANFAKHFTEDFGFNLSASFRRRFSDNLQINPSTTVPEVLFPQTFTAADGSTVVLDDADTIEDALELVPTDFIDIENFTTEQVDYEAADIERDNINVSGSFQWNVTDTTTLTLGGRYSETESDEIISNIEFDVDNDDFDTVDGVVRRTFDDPEITFEGQIEDEFESQSSIFLRGETVLEKWTFNYIAGSSRAFRENPILSIDFTNDFDDVPGGTNDNAVAFAPFNLDASPFVAPVPGAQDVFTRALDPFCLDDDGEACGEINDFDEELQDSEENKRFSLKFDAERSFDDDGVLQSIKFGVQYERSEFTDLVITLSNTDDLLSETGEYLGTVDTFPDNNAVAGDLGVFTRDIRTFGPIDNPFANIGFNGIPVFDGDGLRNIRNNFRNGFFASGDDPQNVELTEAVEKFYSAYVQAKLKFGDWDIVGGFRMEQYQADLSAPADFTAGVFFEETPGNGDSVNLTPPDLEQNLTDTDNFEFLPRIAATYNIADNLLFRASYTTSIARPTFDLLAASIEGDFDVDLNDGVAAATATLADVDQVEADFELGNPDLKNAYSQNFDLSLEYYIDAQNAITAAVFYKKIDDFIFSNFATDTNFNAGGNFDPAELLNNVPFTGEGAALIDQLGGFDALLSSPNATVNIIQSQNGGKADVFGLELGFYHTFSYLPGWLQNAGVIANFTFQESSTDINLGSLGDPDLAVDDPEQNILVQLGLADIGDPLIQEFSFFNSPEEVANVALFYDSSDFEAALSYRYSGIQLEEIEAFGISQYQQERGFLDFTAEYKLRNLDFGPLNRLTFYFRASDLTDSGRKFSVNETRGRSDRFSDLATYNGRTFRFGIRARF